MPDCLENGDFEWMLWVNDIKILRFQVLRQERSGVPGGRLTNDLAFQAAI
jgi:hypothetical protein